MRRLAREGVPEGQRNSTIASLTGHLLWHGVDPEVALEFCWPGTGPVAGRRSMTPRSRGWCKASRVCMTKAVDLDQ